MSDTSYNEPSGRAMPKRTTLERRPIQDQRILELLIADYPNWVPLPKILALGVAQYNARIWTLRHKRGYDIQNRLVDLPDGRKGGEFRLASLLPDPRIAESPALVPASPTPRTKSSKQLLMEKVEKAEKVTPDDNAGLFDGDRSWQEATAIEREMRTRERD